MHSSNQWLAFKTGPHLFPPTYRTCLLWTSGAARREDLGRVMQQQEASPATLGWTERVGVCFSGWAGVSVSEGGESIRRHLLEPLGAEVLIAMTYKPGLDNCTTNDDCAVHERFPALAPFAAVDVRPMVTTEWLVEAMESRPHWSSILHSYGSGRNSTDPHAVRCQRAPSGRARSNSSPYRCDNIYMGNTIFAPVLGSPNMNVLRQLHDLRRCLSLIEKRELQMGGQYQRIIHSRIEDIWLRDHPPLSILPATHVWVPSGEDHYGGLNDRHAVLSRSAANVYMRRWDYLIDGTIMNISQEFKSGAHMQGSCVRCNSENYLRQVLHHFGLQVGRFPGVQFLGCCRANASCFNSLCVWRSITTESAAQAVCATVKADEDARADDLKDAMRRELLRRHGSSTFLGHGHELLPADAIKQSRARGLPVKDMVDATDTLSISGKYPVELEMSAAHAIALSIPGARFLGTQRKDALQIAVPRTHEAVYLALAARLKRRHIGSALRDIVWVDSQGKIEKMTPPGDNSTKTATSKSLSRLESRRPAPEIMSLLLQLGGEDHGGHGHTRDTDWDPRPGRAAARREAAEMMAARDAAQWAKAKASADAAAAAAAAAAKAANQSKAEAEAVTLSRRKKAKAEAATDTLPVHLALHAASIPDASQAEAAFHRAAQAAAQAAAAAEEAATKSKEARQEAGEIAVAGEEDPMAETEAAVAAIGEAAATDSDAESEAKTSDGQQPEEEEDFRMKPATDKEAMAPPFDQHDPFDADDAASWHVNQPGMPGGAEDKPDPVGTEIGRRASTRAADARELELHGTADASEEQMAGRARGNASSRLNATRSISRAGSGAPSISLLSKGGSILDMLSRAVANVTKVEPGEAGSSPS